MITGDNPYAPPQTSPAGFPDAPEPFGWEVVGNRVMANQTAQFPMIDPFTGGTAETMMLQRVHVRYRPRWLLVFPILGALAMLTVEESGNASNLLSFALAGILLGWLVSLIAGLFFPVCTLLLFFERRTLGIRKIAARTMTLLFLTGFFGRFVFFMVPPWMLWISTTAFFCWFIGLLAGVTLVRRLHCNRKSGGRFEVLGFHSLALAAMTPPVSE
jgi:hypothetical protein